MRVGDRLTQHFNVNEVLVGSELDIVPAQVRENVTIAAQRMEDVRQQLGRVPITPTSWYRSLAHNARVGGSPTSDHMTGFAVDFVAAGLSPREVMNRLAGSVSRLGIDQLIEYQRHVHVSFNPRRRGELLVKRTDGGFDPWNPYTQPTSVGMEPGSPTPTPKTVKIAGILAALAAVLAALAKALGGGQ